TLHTLKAEARATRSAANLMAIKNKQVVSLVQPADECSIELANKTFKCQETQTDRLAQSADERFNKLAGKA
ncbi:hypothetical protein GGH96_006393, partial [Coemansia sp. RSA 1972]